ncbi:MAG TPA: ArsI/CadI family heavy metal resistance metalloenzyme [Usitatibacteraceae bacterium]
MKRFHVHVAVSDLAQGIRFYAGMFGQAPTVRKDDYAKWMLDDPRVNFAISARGNAAGVNHLGIQAESAEELTEIHQRLQSADQTVQAEPDASCCYAKSDKYWVTDPAGVAWESFHTLGDIPTFNGSADLPVDSETAATACCTPSAQPVRVEFPKKSAKGGCCV